MRPFSLILVFLVALFLVGCAGGGAALTETPLPPTATVQPTEPSPTATPPPTETPTSTPSAQLSFEPATYVSESAGFELDYPASWTPSGEVALGDRGSGVQFTSGGEPVLDITILRWDPVNDLAAFVDSRKQAWQASGFTILSEDELTLEGDHKAKAFVVQTPTGEQAFFLYTTLGDRYLQLSGNRDLDLLREVAGTLRVLTPEPEPGLTNVLDCSAVVEDTGEWVACNVMAGISSRNLSALHGYMADPFTIGYWGSEWRSAPPPEITAELARDRLPADPSMPLAFTTVPGQFPPLAGQPVGDMLGPDINVVLVVYSEGWGPDGQGAALLFVAQDPSGKYYWPGMVYSSGHFDK